MNRFVSALAASAILSSMCGAVRADSAAPCDLRDAETDPRAGTNSAIAELCQVREGLARIRLGKVYGFVNKAGKLVIAPAYTSATDFSEGAAAVEIDGKWTFIARDGKQAFAPRAGRIGILRNGLAAAEENGKWGFIDLAGNWRIKPQFDTATAFAGRAALVTSAGRSMLLDREGKVLRELPAGSKVGWSATGAGLHTVLVEPAPVLAHRDGRRLPYPEGAVAESFDNGRLVVNRPVKLGLETAQRAGLMGADGKWIIEPAFKSIGQFRDGISIAQTGAYALGDFGLIDERGQFVAKPIYSEITFNEKTGLYQAKRRNGVDLLDRRGRLVAQGVCGEAQRLTGPWIVLSECEMGFLVHETRGIAGSYPSPRIVAAGSRLIVTWQPSQDDEGSLLEVLDYDGKVVLSREVWKDELRYTTVFAEGRTDLPLALVTDGGYGAAFIDHQLKVITKPEWRMVYTYSEAPAERVAARTGPLLMATEDGHGAVDMQGNWVVAPRYESLTMFEHGLAFGRRNDTVFVVDAKGTEYKIPEGLSELEAHAPGVVSAEDDENGAVLLDLKTGAVTKKPYQPAPVPQGTRLVAIEKDDRWGLTNPQGQWVVQPTYDSEPERVGESTPLGWITRADSATDDTAALLGWIDASGKERHQPRFSKLEFNEADKLLVVSEGERSHGLMALDGSFVVPMSDARVTPLKDGWFVLNRDATHGVLNDAGDWVVPLGAQQYVVDKDEQLPAPRSYAQGHAGQASALVDGKGRVSTQAAPVALANGTDASQWWWQPAADDTDDSVQFYSTDFKRRVKLPGAPTAPAFSEGVIAFSLLPRGEEIKTDVSAKKKLLGLADTRGRVLGRYTYLTIEPMREGLALASRAIGATDEQIRDASKTGSVFLDVFYGYLNRAGKTSIGFRFSRAGSFSEGRATALRDGQMLMIDTAGKTIVQGAWLCGREPVLLDAKRNILWPESAKAVTSCPAR